MKLFNKYKIVKVESVHKSPSNFFRREVRKYGWPWNRKKRILYCHLFSEDIEEKDIKKYLFEDNDFTYYMIGGDGIIYNRPKLIISFVGGHKDIIYYDTDDEADEALNNMYEKFNYLRTTEEIVNHINL